MHNDPIREVVRRYWGYDALRPLQHEAMSAAIAGEDALVVMPTGGGKSLCYQAPALLADKPTVVVSPLIALMKDQVDALRARDIPAAFLNSSLTIDDRRRVAGGIQDGTYKLIFVAPERFASEVFWNLLASGGIGAFAIDEAHCISHWGHDFRGDYRRLDQLKARFPNASVHAFTATATPRVRGDIIEQLHLRDPRVLVGDFFRPNLTYRAIKRSRGFDDVVEAVKARRDRAGIVYCIRRRDVDELTAWLRSDAGLRVEGYHAGMSDDARTRVQDAFAAGECDVIVATVAFGMGIDRSDIRFVIHAALPQSLEHYQQETGRAGRDGAPAECILFHSGSDFGLWKSIITKEASENTDDQLAMLGEMYTFATGMSCRHRTLVTYFGQEWTRESCDACDVCTGDVAVMPDSTTIAQKIMSAVYRTGERFGAAYISEVLVGSFTERVEARGHNELPTFGVMRDYPKKHISAWIDQLTGQSLLEREGEYRILKITRKGWQVLRSEEEAKLIEPATSATTKKPKNRAATVRERNKTREQLEATTAGSNKAPARLPEGPLSLDDQELFEKLREVRREIADEMNVPAFVVFSDKTLRALARAKPKSEEEMLTVKGIGPSKLAAFGEQFLKAIA
ncbi:MAG: ATP-dependent DNA helicase RecQ [Phycisphaerales bacterium]|nr:ATP-dependent DNA helicase RecQ [Phycisphaerales bacterium]